MNQAEQAQKGFKTFILTLAISLIVFSAIYYMLTNSSSYDAVPDIESSDKTAVQVPAEKSSDAGQAFGKLASQKITDVQPQMVLAAGDVVEPTQATGTPGGGVVSITIGLITSVAVFLFGMSVLARDPRRLALQSFEEKIRRGL